MKQQVLVSIDPDETRLVVIEDNVLSEVAVERTETGHIVGNIYKGRVKNILPGMQAAFIDIGTDKNAFLYMGDVFPHIPTRAGMAEEVLVTGQELLIQIAKDALGAKGPRATTHLTLPGRYVVLMPTADYVAVSRRIACASERERLLTVADAVRPQGMGVIVRTAAVGKTEAELLRDIQYLHALWLSIMARAKRYKAPIGIYRDVDLVIRVVRDYLSNDLCELVVDDQDAYNRILELLTLHSPELAEKVIYYAGTDLFAHYRLEKPLAALGDRQVWLDCGGYLIFDRTEALTIIDVNTGKFTGDSNLEDTVFRTNLEAAEAIARQLRLRDIGGIILIDFIDMHNADHKQAVVAALTAAVKIDRTKSTVVGITGLGLVEMTRKKTRQNLDALLYTQCPCCEGRGRVRSPITIALQIKRRLREAALRSGGGAGYIIQLHPQVAAVLTEAGQLAKLAQKLQLKLEVEPLTTMHPEAYSLIAISRA